MTKINVLHSMKNNRYTTIQTILISNLNENLTLYTQFIKFQDQENRKNVILKRFFCAIMNHILKSIPSF